MLPSVVVGVDEWPRTSSGKIDRRRLPAASLASSACAGGSVVGPRSASESAARDAMAGVLRLGAESVSVEASFFELGGNSLRAVLLSRALCAALGREVAVAEVLQRPTAAGLASSVGDGGFGVLLPPLARRVEASALVGVAHAVSWNQSQLLTVHAAEPSSAAYNIPMPRWLSAEGVPSSSWGALRLALAEVARRHAVLRTTYEVCSDGGFVGRVGRGAREVRRGGERARGRRRVERLRAARRARGRAACDARARGW